MHTGLCVNGNGQCAHTYFCGLSLSVRAHIGGLGALLLVCAHVVTLKNHVGRITERRSGGDRETEGGKKAKPGARRREERVREAMKKWVSRSRDPASLSWSLIQQAAAAESPPWVGKPKEKRIKTMPPKVSHAQIRFIHSVFIVWRSRDGWTVGHLRSTPVDGIRIERQ